MKFSIIVPFHNAQGDIERCVSSLLQQNVANKEILLIDDHSEDKTAEICQRMAENHPEIFFLHSTGSGVSAARNTGLECATGDIIGFCDSDDSYEPYTLEIVQEAFRSFCADAVVGGIRRVKDSEAGFQTIRVSTLSFDRVCSFQDLLSLTFTHGEAIMGSCCNKFFKKSLIESVRFDETLTHCEDMHFVFRILSHHRDNVCAILAKSLYNYSIKSIGSVTRPKNKADLFETDGTFRYISALRAIERDCPLTDLQRKYLKDLKTMFAINGLWTLRCYRGAAYEKQITLIKNGFSSFLYGRPVLPKIKGIAKLLLWHIGRIRMTVFGQGKGIKEKL